MTPEVPGYDVIAQLGAGGNAVVYRAVQLSVAAHVALKVLRDALTESDRRRAAAERRALGAMRGHPNIVVVHDAGVTEGGRDWIAMELLEGGSLADRITDAGALPLAELRTVGVAIASALEAAHEAGLVHRDVKPANILFDTADRPKLADFGIARDSAAETTTASSSMTVAYAPPEVIDGGAFTPAGDVYSLAVVLLEVATGSQPFMRETDTSMLAVLHRIATQDVGDLSEAGLPHDVAELIRAAMSPDPSARPSAASLRARLEGVAPDGGLGVPGIEGATPIGDGAFGTVYRAHQTLLGRPVAVKVIRQPVSDEESARLFRRECASLAALSDVPGIVAIHDAGVTADGRPYLVMPLLTGGTLQDVLDRDGRLPAADVRRVMALLATALAAAHERGVLHLDIKPENVLLDAGGRPHLADFGIGRVVTLTTATASGAIRGTPLYAAPEVMSGDPPAAEADVWSLGAMLHSLLAGRPAFDGPGGMLQVMERVRTTDPPALPGAPEDLAELAAECMRRDPSGRPSAAEAAARLAPPLVEPPPVEPPPVESSPPDPSPVEPSAPDPPRTPPRAPVHDMPASRPESAETIQQPGAPEVASARGRPVSAGSRRGLVVLGILLVGVVLGAWLLNRVGPITVAVGHDEDHALVEAVDRALGTDVEILDLRPADSGLDRVPALVDGTADMAIVTANEFLELLDSGEEFEAIAALTFPGQQLEPGDRVTALAPADGDVSSLEDPDLQTACSYNFGLTRYVQLYVQDALDQAGAEAEILQTDDDQSALDSLASGRCQTAFVDRAELSRLQQEDPELRASLREIWTSPVIPNDPLVVGPGVSQVDRGRLDEVAVDSRLFGSFGLEATDNTPYEVLREVCRRQDADVCRS